MVATSKHPGISLSGHACHNLIVAIHASYAMLFRAMACHVMPCHIMVWPAVSCHVMPCRVVCCVHAHIHVHQSGQWALDSWRWTHHGRGSPQTDLLQTVRLLRLRLPHVQRQYIDLFWHTKQIGRLSPQLATQHTKLCFVFMDRHFQQLHRSPGGCSSAVSGCAAFCSASSCCCCATAHTPARLHIHSYSCWMCSSPQSPRGRWGRGRGKVGNSLRPPPSHP